MFGETDEALARKVPVALENGLLPILCCGETEEERERNDTDKVLRRQIEADLSRVPEERLGDVVIAYEPIWAIGTGRTATSEQAEDACGFIRSLVAQRNESAAQAIRILYGGSVKPGNAAELLGREEIDGALVGGASLDPEDFAAIVAAASEAA
jgi:triosephosphate isomerase